MGVDNISFEVLMYPFTPRGDVKQMNISEVIR